jgi:predicted ATPase/class 3 adenylate cyclase
MRELPTGTVTFLFTDIEGSTKLLRELGAERYAEALAEHRRALRSAFTRAGGVEVDTQGDAFFYAFPTAPSALGAASEAQATLAEGPISVRMGLHTGTPVVTDEGYVGEDVHRAARIAASGHGGQVLASAATAVLAAAEDLRDLGEHRLKDLSAPERIYQLGSAEFPPLATLFRTNLPVPSTRFLGRDRELGEVVELIAADEVRLLTLTGPGGTGKTRLALQAAAAAAGGYPGGVWWVPLAQLRNPELVLSAAGQALGAQEALAVHVGERRMLILFDNFEHVVSAAPRLAELLGACPRLDLLVTSRESLHLAAEQEYPVPPFAPDDGIAFFYVRARAARPDLEEDEAVPEICRKLDDLPLALELAAARVKALAPDQLLRRLEQRLPLLTGGARDLPERQRTLRATIAWSHDLLGEDEQRLFRRLSVFAGGWTLEAAEEVAGADLDTLQSLLDKSLVRRSAERYWMLESIREYGAERLEASGEASELRARHAAYFVTFVESAGLTLEPQGLQDYASVRVELANARAALDWCFATEPEAGLRLAVGLEGFWVITDPSEGVARVREGLAHAPDAPLELRARALRAVGSCANPVGDDALAEEVYTRSLEAFRELGDDLNVGVLLLRLGYSAFYRADYKRAGALAEESLALHRTVGYQVGESQALGLAGEVEYVRGDREAGLKLIGESAALAGEAGFPWWRSRMLRKLVDGAFELGRPGETEAWARESLRLMNEIGDRQMTVFALARLARVAAEAGRMEEAGLLWGAIEAEEARRPMGAWAKERDRLATPVLVRAGPDFERGRDRGRQLAFEEVVELALGEGKPVGSGV